MPSRKTRPARTDAALISPDLLRALPLPQYGAESDKKVRGKLLIVAGSARLPGAAVLACRAAFRVGVGNVRLATVARIATHVGIAIPELLVAPLPETSAGTIASAALPLLDQQYAACDAVVLGPGMDEHDETAQVARHVVATCPLPLVVDAHALLALAASDGGNTDISRAAGAAGAPSSAVSAAPTAAPAVGSAGPRLFTPHVGEMSALSGLDERAIERDRPGTAVRWARTLGGTLVLKGRETFIASPDGALYVNTAGSRALGTAGSGDTLAGILGGLLAQGMDPMAAAAWGVYLHALAGEATAHEVGEDGAMASDFLAHLPPLIRYLRGRAVQ
jgi:ADP-dependent NAD(P)H-hydrate dehydratase